MQAIRPSAIVIPESMRHRRLVVIFQVEERMPTPCFRSALRGTWSVAAFIVRRR